jgi:hypothetical protein
MNHLARLSASIGMVVGLAIGGSIAEPAYAQKFRQAPVTTNPPVTMPPRQVTPLLNNGSLYTFFNPTFQAPSQLPYAYIAAPPQDCRLYNNGATLMPEHRLMASLCLDSRIMPNNIPATNGFIFNDPNAGLQNINGGGNQNVGGNPNVGNPPLLPGRFYGYPALNNWPTAYNAQPFYQPYNYPASGYGNFGFSAPSNFFPVNNGFGGFGLDANPFAGFKKPDDKDKDADAKDDDQKKDAKDQKKVAAK